MSERQQRILGMLPRIKGNVRSDFKELERKLSWYKYTDSELDIFEREVSEFVKAQEAKRLAKYQARQRAKQERKEIGKRRPK